MNQESTSAASDRAAVGRGSRAEATRTALLDAAERLFAERGLDNVSNRSISSAAQQGNNAAVGYHFGSVEDLLRALVARHFGPIEDIRSRLVAEVVSRSSGHARLEDWVRCMVRPTAVHLESLGSPTWFARLSAQLATDPRYQDLVRSEATSPALARTLQGFEACLPQLPDAVRAERGEMSRILTVHVLAERERALAAGTSTARGSWSDCADGIALAVTGVWRAPHVARSGSACERSGLSARQPPSRLGAACTEDAADGVSR